MAIVLTLSVRFVKKITIRYEHRRLKQCGDFLPLLKPVREITQNAFVALEFDPQISDMHEDIINKTLTLLLFEALPGKKHQKARKFVCRCAQMKSKNIAPIC